MTTYRVSLAALVGLNLLAACGEPTPGETAGQTEGSTAGSTSVSTGSSTTTPTGSVSDSGTTTEGGNSASDSQASQTATDPTTSATTHTSHTSATTEDPSSTTAVDPSASSTSDPSGTTADASSTAADTTGDPIDETTGDGSSTSTTGPDCIPSPEVCNDVDDDCNSIIDDVDAGGDGICDCLNIALFGNKGANPSAQFEAWLEMQGTQVDRIQIDNTPVTKAILDKYDIIILDWLVRAYTPQEAALVAEWVGEGGGLMSLTGHTNNNTVIDRPNSLIAPMGLSYNGSQGFFSGPVTQWLKPHPITEGINSVSFFGGLYINIVEDGLGTNTVIGTLPQGPVAVAQERKGGKLFIFGDEWIAFDSQWQQLPEIKKFWANSLGWLAPKNFCTVPQ